MGKYKLVLEQKEPRKEFDIRFKDMFGVTFTEWCKTASSESWSEGTEFTDGKIWAGITAYSSGFRVYVEEEYAAKIQKKMARKKKIRGDQK